MVSKRSQSLNVIKFKYVFNFYFVNIAFNIHMHIQNYIIILYDLNNFYEPLIVIDDTFVDNQNILVGIY